MVTIVTSTAGKKGSIKRFVSSIGASIKATFTKPKTTVTTTPSGTKVIVSTSAPTPSPTTSVTRGGGGPAQIQGPIQPGTSAEVFRETGKALQIQTVAPTTPSATTIESQIKGPSPLRIDVAPTPTQQALALGRGVSDRPPKFDVQLLKKAGREFTFVEGTPVQAVGTLFSPLQRFFPKKAGEREFQEPQFGTVTDIAPRGFITTTAIEKQREQALFDPSLLVPEEARIFAKGELIQKELVAELQPKVTAGALTIPEAEAEFGAKFQERFKTEVVPTLEKGREFKGRFEAGQRPVFDVTRAGEFVGLGALSLTPGGQQVVAASFVGSGLPKVTGGEGIVERGLGVFEVGAGLLTGGLAVKGAERLADIALVRELQARPGLVTGVELQRVKGGILFEPSPEIGGVVGREVSGAGEGSLFKLTSIRGLGESGRIETELIAPVFKTGRGKASITGGRGKVTLDFFSIEKGRTIRTTEDILFGGRQFGVAEAPTRISKGIGLERQEILEDFSAGFGKGFVKRRGEETFGEFLFGGVSRDVETELGKITQFQAGKIKTLKLGGITRLRREGLVFKEVRGRFPIEETGIIKRLTLPETDAGVKIVTPAGRRTPFETTIQKTEVPAPIGISRAIEKQLFITQPPKVDVAPTFPIAVGGVGLTQEQLRQQARAGLVQESISEQLLVPPGTKDGIRSFVGVDIIQRPSQVGGISSIVLERAIQREAPSQIGRGFQIPKTALGEKLVSRQVQRQFQVPKQVLEQGLVAPTITTPRGFEPFFDFGFGLPLVVPPFPRLGGTRERKPKKKRARARARIAPSFTAIIADLGGGLPEEFGSLGILPTTLRRLPSKKRVVKKKSKKK